MSKGAFVIIAPNSMAFRAIANSQVLPLLEGQIDQKGYDKIIILSQNDGSQSTIPHSIEWQDFLLPTGKSHQLSLVKRLIRFTSIRVSQLLGLGYENTVYRFNQLQQFFSHRFKREMSHTRRKREELAGNFVSKKFGFPFPDSLSLYTFIYNFDYSDHHIPDPNIDAFFKENKVGKLIFWHVQNPIFREYSLCARKNNIPYIGVIGSWDRPTTKGPICPSCEKYIVNSQVMKNELIKFHKIPETEIEVVGWPQMDAYHDSSMQMKRSDFLSSMGIHSNKRILVYTGNAARLGAHEPSLVKHLAQAIKQGKYGDNIHLIIRPHPQDVDWKNRYHEVNETSSLSDVVTLMPAEMGKIETMVNTLLHADIVLATQGSISLDAAALDKKIINIAFDGELDRNYTESVERWYEMDHYLPVVQSGGVAIVNSFGELDDKIILLLSEDPLIEGRKQLRALELEPFHGDSSLRQVNAMLS